MSVDRRLLNWGVFLILVGGVPLAVAQGWIPRDVVARAWELWPLILVGAGIGLILGATPLRAVGGIIVAATLGTMLGAFLAVGFGAFGLGGLGCGSAAGDAPQVLQESGSFSGGAGRVALTANCASLGVETTGGSTWSIDVHGTDSAKPTIERGADRLTATSPSRNIVFPVGNQRASWHTVLGTDARLASLAVELNAGDASLDLAGETVDRLSFAGNAVGNTRLDLSTATVGQLDVRVNAGDVAIVLPTTADMTGTVEGNAASIDLCSAAGVGLRLVVDDNLTASDNYVEQGLVRSGNTWQTPGFADAATQVELRTTGNAISFTLNPKDGCR